eukprot:7385612-Prymnesium_polylepis.1
MDTEHRAPRSASQLGSTNATSPPPAFDDLRAAVHRPATAQTAAGLTRYAFLAAGDDSSRWPPAPPPAWHCALLPSGVPRLLLPTSNVPHGEAAQPSASHCTRQWGDL